MTKFRRKLLQKVSSSPINYIIDHATLEGEISDVFQSRVIAVPGGFTSGKTYHISFDYDLTNIVRMYSTNYLSFGVTSWCDSADRTILRFDYINTGDTFSGHADLEKLCNNTIGDGAYWAFLFNNAASNMTSCHAKLTNICLYEVD